LPRTDPDLVAEWVATFAGEVDAESGDASTAET
jgi:hypothetical protein